jgi:hypothetical protein
MKSTEKAVTGEGKASRVKAAILTGYRGKALDAYERGMDAGLEHAAYCEIEREEYEKAYHDDTLGEILGDIIENYRQYSPFEFTASEFNRARNSEMLWEAYDDGEYKGWIEGLEKRFGKVSMEG